MSILEYQQQHISSGNLTSNYLPTQLFQRKPLCNSVFKNASSKFVSKISLSTKKFLPEKIELKEINVKNFKNTYMIIFT